ncbi:hypothetical protein NON08_01310 [Cetobacterium somerae]|uniref:hypothetical protein n=1 Tax=Cetobacterium sp. NK01 TaxID=2993530 RepID=UPI0021171D90|nr:hypothetical protein [Cetobacterium sp. NK01]MCQ8211206.1 hypothetical protein [Cetobacterium sp. NK01]
MSAKSKGQEFFASLSKNEQNTIIAIIKLENNPDRLIKKESAVTVKEIKEIIGQYSMEWSD